MAATPKIQTLVETFKAQIEEKLGAVFSVFTAETYSKQLVSGFNYLVKVKVDGDKVVEVMIYEPLPCSGEPKELSAVAYLKKKFN